MTEETIQLIAKAIIANTEALKQLIASLSQEDKQAVAEKVAPAVKPSEISPQAPAPAPAPAPMMPPPPTFDAPAPTSELSPAPFKDSKALVDYVLAKYKALGQKGPVIQSVLDGLGCKNLNDVRPDQYAALYAGIEAIK